MVGSLVLLLDQSKTRHALLHARMYAEPGRRGSNIPEDPEHCLRWSRFFESSVSECSAEGIAVGGSRIPD